MSGTVCAGSESPILTRRARIHQAVVVKPEREKTMYHLAIVLYDIGNIERAKILFEQVGPSQFCLLLPQLSLPRPFLFPGNDASSRSSCIDLWTCLSSRLFRDTRGGGGNNGESADEPT